MGLSGVMLLAGGRGGDWGGGGVYAGVTHRSPVLSVWESEESRPRSCCFRRWGERSIVGGQGYVMVLSCVLGVACMRDPGEAKRMTGNDSKHGKRLRCEGVTLGLCRGPENPYSVSAAVVS